MFAFCTFSSNCVFNYFVWCQLWWATNRIIQYTQPVAARELEKMGSRVIVPKMYCLGSVVRGHHICKRVWTPLVGEKLPVDIKKI